MKKKTDVTHNETFKFIASNKSEGAYAEWKIASPEQFDEAVEWVVDAITGYNEEMGINFVDYDEMERKFRSDLTIDFNNCRFCFQHITDEESQHLLPFEYMERIKDEQINYIK